MKKSLLIFAFFFTYFSSVAGQKEKLEQIFDRYQETEGVTSIKIAKPMFSMLGKLDLGDSEMSDLKPMLDKINGLRMLIIESPRTDSLTGKSAASFAGLSNLQSEISQSLKNLNYEELMSVNSKDAKIKFLSGNAVNGFLENLILSVNAEGSTILMLLDGKVSMEDVNKIASETSISTNNSKKPEINNSPNASRQARSVANFSGVSVSSGVKVNFTQSNKTSVVVDTDADKQNYIKTEVQNGILKISVDNKGKKNLNFKKILVEVSSPNLNRVDVSSGASFNTSNIVREKLADLTVSSGGNFSGDFDLAEKLVLSTTSGSSARVNVKTKEAKIQATSGSSVVVTGNAQQASFVVSSAASCNAQNLASNEVSAQVSSSGSVKVNAKQALKSTTSSGGSVRYQGKPEKFSASNSSGGSTKPID